MKTSGYLFILLFIFSCTSTPDKIRVNGIVQNPVDTFITIEALMNPDTFFIATLDQDQRFNVTIPADTSAYYIIEHGEEAADLYLEPGYNLKLSLNSESLQESMLVSGKGAGPSNYLTKKAIWENDWPDDDELFRMQVNDFKSELETRYAEKEEILNGYKGDVPEDFWVREEAINIMVELYTYYEYPWEYRYRHDTDEVDLGENYDSYLEELDLNRPEYLEIPFFTQLAMHRIMLTADELIEKSKEEEPDVPLIYMQSTNQLISNEKVWNNMAWGLMQQFLFMWEINEIGSAIDLFKSTCTSESILNQLNEIVQKKENLAAGNPAPVFSGKDLSGKTISLSDFTGKYVYVDVWATWCGPCLAETPHLQKLEKELHSKNIVIISYSIDDDKEDWGKMVTEEALTGIQIIGEAGWQSKLAVDYMINGIPNYILIDREGKLISANAERPSANIKEIILGLEGI